MAVNLSDPLGRGWNLFGTADLAVSTSIFSHPTAVAVVQLGAVVAGQLLGLIAAHEKAVLLAPRHALAGRWPMLDVMLGYTTGLVLLFAP